VNKIGTDQKGKPMVWEHPASVDLVVDLDFSILKIHTVINITR
jgi:hypothetical protein